MMVMEEPLQLTLTCDWARLRRIYDQLSHKYHSGFFTHRRWMPNAGYTACDIGRHGQLAISSAASTGGATSWISWSGSLLEHMIPWARHLRQLTGDAGIVLQNFGLHRHHGPIGRHVDSKERGDEAHQHRQCNLNYVIRAHDSGSRSYFQRPGAVHCYGSRENSAYLMDSSVPHWVENSDLREVLQIRFHSAYDEVREFFNQRRLVLA